MHHAANLPSQPFGRPVRVRIAPSPTGDPHVGTAYIALFNYVFAKQHGGKFILRIEDTDQNRARHDSEDMIMSCLRWTGLQWDEGPDVGGSCGPYRQSERIAIYQEHAQALVDKGHAYHCFCTPQRLDELRKIQQAQKLPPGYDGRCRFLSQQEVQEHLKQNTPHVVRAKMPRQGKTLVQDRLRGIVEFENSTIDDQVLLKSDGFPTYHLANVVDDHLMGISHVIRAEEWISSTPKHVLLYDFFGWEKPEFIHMPLLRNADKSKISKRKNPTSINYYRRKGVLPSALRNFLANMGWSFGQNKELFSTQEMIDNFSWDKVSLGGPVFDQQKLVWLNGHYLRAMDDADYLKYLQDELFSSNYLSRIIPLIKDRIEKFDDFVTATEFFFSGDLQYSVESMLPKGGTPETTASHLENVLAQLEAVDGWETATIQLVFENYLKQHSLKPKDVYMPTRIAVTGKKDSPPLFETIAVLGKEIVRRRMRLAIQCLETAAVVTAKGSPGS